MVLAADSAVGMVQAEEKETGELPVSQKEVSNKKGSKEQGRF